MPRKIALIGAGLLTGIIAAAVLTVSIFNEAGATDGAEIPIPDAAEVEGQQFSEFEAALAAREAALQDNLAQRQQALTDLDEVYQEQFDALEARLEKVNGQAAGATERVEALQTEAANIQDEIAAADAAFQEEITGLQNNLTYQDSQMRQEIEVVYGQLQQAYEQIAAQEAASMQASGGGGSSNAHDGEHHDDDDHHDGGEHDDDHDDD